MRAVRRRVIPFVASMTRVALAASCVSSSEHPENHGRTSVPSREIPAAQDDSDPGLPTPTPCPTALCFPGSPDGSIPPPPATPTIAGVTVSAMHVERQDGFDRIVYDFGGTYSPGWRAEYVAEATERGQETATPINGRSILQIYFFDTVPPAESGIPGYHGPNPLSDPLSDPAAHSVVEVLLGQNFDRTTQSFVGLRTDHPQFQVTNLRDPARIAVDIYP